MIDYYRPHFPWASPLVTQREYCQASFTQPVNAPRQAWARANRLATLCRQAGVRIQKRSLYLCFTPVLADGAIRPTEYRDEVWQRYVMYGLPLTFNHCDAESRVKRVWLATIDSLRAIVPPEQIAEIEAAAKIVEAGGEELQFTLVSAKTKHYLIDLTYTIPTWPFQARLLLTLTDRTNQAKSECVLFKSKITDECGFLGGKVKIVEGNIVVSPRSTSIGNYYAKRNNLSCFVVGIDELLRGATSVTRVPWESSPT